MGQHRQKEKKTAHILSAEHLEINKAMPNVYQQVGRHHCQANRRSQQYHVSDQHKTKPAEAEKNNQGKATSQLEFQLKQESNGRRKTTLGRSLLVKH